MEKEFIWNDEEHAKHFPSVRRTNNGITKEVSNKRSTERSRENLYRGGEEEAGGCEE